MKRERIGGKTGFLAFVRHCAPTGEGQNGPLGRRILSVKVMVILFLMCFQLHCCTRRKP
ncbi:hypothetical protein BVI2075_780018 [Burkholderia vietnamiensis]|nr:hypothetical protein BVI2075_780018 [Burkholderia vietnamiensis]